MRQITVDFSSPTSPLFAGYIGEHNATELIVIKPEDLSGEMYSLAFMTNGEVIHSKYFSTDEEIRILLWKQLTQDNILYVQLEAYDENGKYLGKSAKVKLLLSNSVHGTDVVADTDNPDVYADIAQNTLFRESLKDNAETLKKLSTSEDGKSLLFDGNEMNSGVDVPTKTSELENDSGFITADDLPESDFSQFVEKLGNGVNLYEPQTEGWVDDACLQSDGSIVIKTNTYKSYAVTPQIPINGGTTYTVCPFLWPNALATKLRARTYDVNNSPLDILEFTDNEAGSTFITPESSTSIRFTVYVPLFGGTQTEGADDINTVIEKFNSSFMFVEGTEAPEEYESFGNSGYRLKDIALPDKSVNLEKVSNEALPLFAPLAGKKIANFGDSIFGNARPPKDVSTFLAEKTGAEVLNCAFGGCRMGAHIGHWDCFSMYRLADAIANNDYSLQEDALNYDDRVSYAETPLALIKSTDFSTVDILTIAYGTNDFTGGNALDNDENPLDTTTLAGALRYSVEKLLTAFPNLRIFIVSTTYRFWKDENNEYTEDSKTYLNKHSKTLPEYNAKLKEVAEQYNLPFIDNYNIGIGKFNRYQYFPVTDGTHHNETGRKLIAEHLAGALTVATNLGGGADGNDYVLTDADKAEIAGMVETKLKILSAIVDSAEENVPIAAIHTIYPFSIAIEAAIPENARVKRIEIPDIVNETDELFALEDMAVKDADNSFNSPYLIMYPKNSPGIFYEGTFVAAVVSFPTQATNEYYSYAGSGSFSGKEIKIYYEIEE